MVNLHVNRLIHSTVDYANYNDFKFAFLFEERPTSNRSTFLSESTDHSKVFLEDKSLSSYITSHLSYFSTSSQLTCILGKDVLKRSTDRQILDGNEPLWKGNYLDQSLESSHLPFFFPSFPHPQNVSEICQKQSMAPQLDESISSKGVTGILDGLATNRACCRLWKKKNNKKKINNQRNQDTIKDTMQCLCIVSDNNKFNKMSL